MTDSAYPSKSGSDNFGSIRVKEVSFPAHRCPACGVIYPDPVGRAVLVCYCREAAGETTETVPVGALVRYLNE